MTAVDAEDVADHFDGQRDGEALHYVEGGLVFGSARTALDDLLDRGRRLLIRGGVNPLLTMRRIRVCWGGSAAAMVFAKETIWAMSTGMPAAGAAVARVPPASSP